MVDANNPNWSRRYFTFPSGLPIFETNFPQPGIVLLSQHYINPGLTRARSEWVREQGRSVNVHAGEEGTEYSEEHGVDLPSKPRRLPKVEGLGADEPPRRRIVTGPSTTVQVDPTKPLPKGASAAERLAWEREVTKLWEKKIKDEEKAGVAVRGWRVRALSPKKEMEIAGENLGTAAKLSSLVRRIPRDQRAWLQSGMMAHGDPYNWLRTSQEERVVWTLWIRPDCIGWLAEAGRDLGIYFGAPPSPNPNFPSQAEQLRLDIQKYISGEMKCSPKTKRGLGIRSAASVLGVGQLEPLSASALKLFQMYQDALRTSEDKELVHEAYHRILLTRFLRRRSLVPQARRGSFIGEEAERRANLLQAHRMFVFNRNGCPVKLNKSFLEANGIDLKSLLNKNPFLLHKKNISNQYTVNEWTKWLFEEVLKKELVECRTVLTSESVDGLLEMAGLGILG